MVVVQRTEQLQALERWRRICAIELHAGRSIRAGVGDILAQRDRIEERDLQITVRVAVGCGADPQTAVEQLRLHPRLPAFGLLATEVDGARVLANEGDLAQIAAAGLVTRLVGRKPGQLIGWPPAQR